MLTEDFLIRQREANQANSVQEVSEPVELIDQPVECIVLVPFFGKSDQRATTTKRLLAHLRLFNADAELWRWDDGDIEDMGTFVRVEVDGEAWWK